MRKSIITPQETKQSHDSVAWLNLEHLALAEISSEEADYPIDAALNPELGSGWRASTAGAQIIRLRFDQPLHLHRIQLVFHEAEHPRTQEFVLRWSVDGGQAYQEIVRQQYTFSPSGTFTEVEDYQVDLDGVTVLELYLIPDISGGPARATLTALQLA